MGTETAYDTIVVGSGNGACGFLSHYLEHCDRNSKVLVLEIGNNFFNTSDLTHQINWTKAYAEGNIFKLHNALTPDNVPVISGWACTMGGGGSINYTMIHESSTWLATHIGHDVDYWNTLKLKLNAKFHRLDPASRETPVTKHILQVGTDVGFRPANPDNRIKNIPNYRDYQDYPDGNANQLYQFPTQFNPFGQRTYSGVSIVDWFCDRIQLKTQCKVVHLEFAPTDSGEHRCIAIQTKNMVTGESERFTLSDQGRLLLCAGAATPRLLLPHRETLNNPAIGQHVSDQIVLPLGVYLTGKQLKVTPKDVYAPVFATTVWKPEEAQPGQPTVCCFDFFAGNFEKLWFLISHLYLAFLLPNFVKKIVIRTPWLFTITKNAVRILIQIVNFFINLGAGVNDLLNGRPWQPDKIDLITAVLKYNPAVEGEYSNNNDKRITLGFFATDEDPSNPNKARAKFNQDKEVAKKVIAQQLPLMENLGAKPPWIVQCILRLFTHIPFNERQIDDYVETYSKKFLLSEQHMAGGCLFGKALDKGLEHSQNTGKVYGSTNVHVADLSASPLPRISPQMTAYLMGFHVAKQLYPDKTPSGKKMTDKQESSG